MLWDNLSSQGTTVLRVTCPSENTKCYRETDGRSPETTSKDTILSPFQHRAAFSGFLADVWGTVEKKDVSNNTRDEGTGCMGLLWQKISSTDHEHNHQLQNRIHICTWTFRLRNIMRQSHSLLLKQFSAGFVRVRCNRFGRVCSDLATKIS